MCYGSVDYVWFPVLADVGDGAEACAGGLLSVCRLWTDSSVVRYEISYVT